MEARNPEDAAIDPVVADAADGPVFDATITPHRSLGARGVRTVLTLVCLVSVAASIPFVVLGAWPVAGFFGLDVLALFIAFRVNLAGARAFERVVVTPLEVFLAQVSARGLRREWRFNPAWTRLHADHDADYGVMKLAVVSRGVHVQVARTLSPAERETFAEAFGGALAKARGGARYDLGCSVGPDGPSAGIGRADGRARLCCAIL